MVYNYMNSMMYQMMYGSYGFGLGILAWVTSLLFIGLIIAAIYWLVKSANRENSRRKR